MFWVDLRSFVREMGDGFHDEIERHTTAAHRKSSPATLRIRAGAPFSIYGPASWVACGVDFFFGDCVPNLDRPAKSSWMMLFDHIMCRQEFE